MAMALVEIPGRSMAGVDKSCDMVNCTHIAVIFVKR